MLVKYNKKNRDTDAVDKTYKYKVFEYEESVENLFITPYEEKEWLIAKFPDDEYSREKYCWTSYYDDIQHYINKTLYEHDILIPQDVAEGKDRTMSIFASVDVIKTLQANGDLAANLDDPVVAWFYASPDNTYCTLYATITALLTSVKHITVYYKQYQIVFDFIMNLNRIPWLTKVDAKIKCFSKTPSDDCKEKRREARDGRPIIHNIPDWKKKRK